MLAIKNENAKMRNESEWRSEVRSRGQASIQSYRSEYPTATETLWVEFTVLFDERRKREKRSPCLFAVTSQSQILNKLIISLILSIYLFLNLRRKRAILASFYRHQKSPQHTSLDKIEAWIEREGKKKDSSVIISNSSRNNLLSSSNIILDDNNNDNLGSNMK
ncbi:hypothetical protein Glove_566g40 [Diversispora epigaea]|uniref:Uncharacterized protein n=1 Tax=Diversispora epigaea TaxID=1348612 RepID=A0A397GBL2_9GLOM|nr:hypothetical protein Glove_566g40 [Diversispora epigaea]